MDGKTDRQALSAKAKHSQPFNRALEDETQRTGTLAKFLARLPLRDVSIDVRERADTGREVDL